MSQRRSAIVRPVTRQPAIRESRRRFAAGRRSLVSTALLSCLIAAPLSARQWVATDGRRLDADLVKIVGDKATLKPRGGGRPVTAPVSSLSEADRTWIRLRDRLTTSDAGAPFRSDFAASVWDAGFNRGNPNLPSNLRIVTDFPKIGAAPGGFAALEVTLKQGSHYGADFSYEFADRNGPGKTAAEPDEAFLSYSLCFAPDFNAEAVQGGKLPGFGGIYGDTGAAGKKVNGTDSWSARGAYWKPDAEGKIPIGYYVYHADMQTDYGDTWYFPRGLERGKWHRVLLYVRLNTPAGAAGGKGRNDGVLRAWIDDETVFDRRDIRFRDVDRLKIRNAWFHFYHGGGSPATQDYRLWIDDVTIGAMAK
jgi:hypothetical protein